MQPMHAYYCKDFRGFWPVGTAAVVVAESPEFAARILQNTLADMGLNQSIKPEQLRPIPTCAPAVFVLNSGEY